MSVRDADRFLEDACLEGIRHYQAQRIDEALESFHRVLAVDPTHARALNALAVIACNGGDHKVALAHLNTLLAAHPNFEKGFNTLGILQRLQGNFDAAIEKFSKAVAINPSFAEGYGNLGDIYLQQSKWDDALLCYVKVSSLVPDSYQAHYGAGRAFSGKSLFAEAAENFRKALGLKPDSTEAYVAMGDVLRKLGHLQESVSACREGIRLCSASAALYNTLGNALKDQGAFADAQECYGEALLLDPAFYLAELNLASLYWLKGDLQNAAECYERAALSAPDSPQLHGCRGTLFLYQGLVDEAVAALRRGVDGDPENASLHSSLLLAMHYSDLLPHSQIFNESVEWARRHSRPLCARPVPRFGLPLRIGYVSPDFRQHPIYNFFKPLVAAHDHTIVEVHCYSDVDEPDEKTNELRELAAHWTDVAGVPDDKLAEKILADNIDILVDLAGHTANNRLTLFSMKPAPVQVTWLGFPGTTGLSVMDYRISDSVADPEGLTDHLHSEKVIRLPDMFLCYSPPVEAPVISPLPALRNGFITFGSFNNLPKMSYEVLRLWATILKRLPSSCLLLKTRSFNDKVTCRRITELLEHDGVDAARITLLPYVQGVAGHLACYSEIDISLDTFPYNGTTTTCEALWMGVPVVSLAGKHHAARVGASIMSNLGLENLVADSAEEYIAIAERLAQDLDGLNHLRQTLRERLSNGVLCDSAAFAQQMEEAYMAMVRHLPRHEGTSPYVRTGVTS